MKYNFVFFMAAMIIVGACQRGSTRLPPEVAMENKPALSPSGKYVLVVIAEPEGAIPYRRFHILDRNGTVLYKSAERYDVRHTTFFLWDRNDRVWVYSGDIGTFFWEYKAQTGQWEEHIYGESVVSAPEFLKRVRPRSHKR